MEAVEIDARLFQELEKDTDALLGVLDGVRPVIPGIWAVPPPNGSARGLRMTCQ